MAKKAARRAANKAEVEPEAADTTEQADEGDDLDQAAIENAMGEVRDAAKQMKEEGDAADGALTPEVADESTDEPEDGSQEVPETDDVDVDETDEVPVLDEALLTQARNAGLDDEDVKAMGADRAAKVIGQLALTADRQMFAMGQEALAAQQPPKVAKPAAAQPAAPVKPVAPAPPVAQPAAIPAVAPQVPALNAEEVDPGIVQFAQHTQSEIAELKQLVQQLVQSNAELTGHVSSQKENARSSAEQQRRAVMQQFDALCDTQPAELGFGTGAINTFEKGSPELNARQELWSKFQMLEIGHKHLGRTSTTRELYDGAVRLQCADKQAVIAAKQVANKVNGRAKARAARPAKRTAPQIDRRDRAAARVDKFLDANKDELQLG